MFGLFNRKKDSFQHIGIEAFKKLKKQQGVVVLDVRTPKEVASGAVPGHRAIDVSSPDFRTKVDKLDRDKTYLVYCRSGMRSAKACRVMSGMGFLSLYNFKGGIMAWNNGR